MENYDEFLTRINSFEKSKIDFGSTYFTGNQSIEHKVNRDNTFKKFYGDTVVFDLDEATKAAISQLVDFLYEATPQCFCERLVPDTFHMTLHDLSNSEVLQNISDEMFYNELKIIKAKNQIEKLGNNRIKMKSNAIFNMVNTSLVLGLYPIDRNNYIKLMELYRFCEKAEAFGHRRNTASVKHQLDVKLLVSVVGEVCHGIFSFVCDIQRLSVDLFIHIIKVGEKQNG